MCHKLLKRILVVLLSAGLVLSQAVPSFADTKGEMDPDDYLFLTIFRACGVSPGVDVGRWAALYKGYLRATGNQAMLSQVEGYSSLSWGHTVQGVDTLFKSVKGWLSLSNSYGSSEVGYSLPSSPSPQDTLSSLTVQRLVQRRFLRCHRVSPGMTSCFPICGKVVIIVHYIN